MKIEQTLFLLLITLNLHALSLDEAIATAQKNSLDMKKLSMNIEIAKASIKEKQSSHFGRVDLLASYTHYNLPRTLTPLTPASIAGGAASIPTTQDMMVAGVSYRVDLFTGMSDTRSIEIADIQKSMAKNLQQISSEQLTYNVTTLYINILATNSKIEAQKEYVQALQRLYENIELKVKLEKLSKIDALKSLAELSRAKSNLTSLITNRDILKDTLATTMNVPSISKLEELSIEVKDFDTQFSQYEEKLMKTKKLEISRESIQKSIKQEQKASAMYYPKISFNGYYGQSAGVNDDTNPKSGDFNNEEVWQAGVDLKWNIFDFGKTSALNQKSKIAIMQAKLEKSKTKRELQRSLREALSKINLAISSYHSASVEHSLMQETQKIEQIRYDNGASDINDLLYTKARYQLANSAYITSKYDYQNTINYLNYLLEQGNKK